MHRILIVDDEPLNLDLLSQELSDMGHVIDTAAGGVEALAKVAAVSAGPSASTTAW